jgi:hypothetical protein
MSLNFRIVANNTIPVQFQVFEPPSYDGGPVGPPVNITGFTIKWQAQTPTPITKTTGAGSITLTNPTIGIFTVQIDAADTLNVAPGSYTHEAVTTDTDGNPVTIVNADPVISAGTMTIRKQYTVQ